MSMPEGKHDIEKKDRNYVGRWASILARTDNQEKATPRRGH